MKDADGDFVDYLVEQADTAPETVQETVTDIRQIYNGLDHVAESVLAAAADAGRFTDVADRLYTHAEATGLTNEYSDETAWTDEHEQFFNKLHDELDANPGTNY